MNQKIIIKNIKTIVKNFPVKKVQVYQNEIVIFVHIQHLLKMLLFLKSHVMCQYNVLTCISGVDYFQKYDRFETVYDLLSIRYNNRIRVKVSVNQLQFVDSCEKIYPSAGWYECEIFDMFGIFFSNHKNLKRILTDYGFEGYPLRKDFPLSGYVELRYDDRQKRIISEYIELAQEYRTFDFLSPWNHMKI